MQEALSPIFRTFDHFFVTEEMDRSFKLSQSEYVQLYTYPPFLILPLSEPLHTILVEYTTT